MLFSSSLAINGYKWYLSCILFFSNNVALRPLWLSHCHQSISLSFYGIEAFKKEESLNKIYIKQYVAGHYTGVKRKYKNFAEI